MKSERLKQILNQNESTSINLYVCGGGKRSARTAGMLSAIESEGLTDTFDYVVAQSAGSFSVMFLLGGRATEAAAEYWGNFVPYYHKREFINPWNIFLPRPVLNVRALVYDYFETKNPIPWQKVIDHPLNTDGQLLIQVMDANTGKTAFLSRFKTARALKEAIIASSWLPLIVGWKPYTLSPAVLSELTVLNNIFKPLRLSTLQTYDGQIVDSVFLNTINQFPDSLHVVCSNTVPGTEDKQFVNPWGRAYVLLSR